MKNVFFALCGVVLLAAFIGATRVDAEEVDASGLLDKTLVVWAAPATLEQKGGSALTIDMADPDDFDAVVFAELAKNTWMAGSTGYRRSALEQDDWLKESEANGEYARICVVYRGKKVEIYRNDKRSASYDVEAQVRFDDSATILIGPRHVADQRDVFVGKIRDARIYPCALTETQIKALKPGKPLDGVQPWFWLDFASTGLYDRAGRFNTASISGDAAVEAGALNLGPNKGKVTFTRVDPDKKTYATPDRWDADGKIPREVALSSRRLRERFLADPYRPRWHFAIPDDNGVPGDPNGCFYADGRYHLMYLYDRAESGFAWGHMTSVDLIHWRHCPDAIGPGGADTGCFSGGAFLDDDGIAYLTYWKLGDLGVGAAKSSAPYYDWKKFDEPIVASTEFGITELAAPDGQILCGSADPSNIWKKDGKYYVLTGNLCLLNKYGREEDSPEDMKGDRLYLFESPDLLKWEYRGVFYQRRDEWTDVSEDNMCPSFLPLPTSPDGGEPSDKHLLLFISHNKGCQYYVGNYDAANDRFLPESHGRMTWVDNTYFAPEALVDAKGRQIMWAWLLDNRADELDGGWCGVYGVPRTLWLGDDGELRMRPVEELKTLRINERKLGAVSAAAKSVKSLSGFPGDSFDMELRVEPAELTKAKRVGVVVREDKELGEKTTLYYDAEARELVFDSRLSGKQGRPALERAPLILERDEPLELRVLVDRSVVEVYANDKQAICRRVYPTRPKKAQNAAFWNDGDAQTTADVRVWEMAESNPF